MQTELGIFFFSTLQLTVIFLSVICPPQNMKQENIQCISISTVHWESNPARIPPSHQNLFSKTWHAPPVLCLWLCLFINRLISVKDSARGTVHHAVLLSGSPSFSPSLNWKLFVAMVTTLLIIRVLFLPQGKVSQAIIIMYPPTGGLGKACMAISLPHFLRIWWAFVQGDTCNC